MQQNDRPPALLKRPEVLISCLLVALALAVYSRACWNGFVYDDEGYVVKNPNVHAGLTRASYRWAFTSTDPPIWHPLTWLSLQLDYQLYGLNPRGFHLTNVALHAANAVLLFLVLRGMTGAVWRSAAVASLLAIHPLHIESVAWVTERKGVLSTFFWLTTLLCYLAYVRRPSVGRYLAALTSFVLGLLAKPMVVTLPCVLCLLDYWPLRRLSTGSLAGQDLSQEPTLSPPVGGAPRVSILWCLLEKVPLFVVVVAWSLITLHVQESARVPMARGGGEARLANALVSYVLYLRNMVWPVGLAAFYPHEGILASGQGAGSPLLAWNVVGSASLLFLISAYAVSVRRRAPYVLVGWLWFLGTLVPVIGIVQNGNQAMADRYAYVPLIGIYLSLIWLLSDWADRLRVPVALRASAFCCLVLGCGLGTWYQLAYWRDDSALWGHALRVTRNNWLAHNNLGNVLAQQGRLAQAAMHFAEAVRIYPDAAKARSNLALALTQLGRHKEAVPQFREMIRRRPKDALAHKNLAKSLTWLWRLDEAEFHLREAVRIDPDDADAHRNLGLVLFFAGRKAEAMESLRRAVELAPGVGFFDLAYVLQQAGREEEARTYYGRAMQIEPLWPQGASQAAWMMATHPDPSFRHGALAVKFAEQACQATSNENPACLDALAAAYAEAGRFDEAIGTVRRALALMTDDSPQRSWPLRRRLELYENRQPFRAGQTHPSF